MAVSKALESGQTVCGLHIIAARRAKEGFGSV